MNNSKINSNKLPQFILHYHTIYICLEIKKILPMDDTCQQTILVINKGEGIR